MATDEIGDGAEDEIRGEVEAIPGVASAEVTFEEGRPPLARVWLDGTGDPEEVHRRVSALLGSHVPFGIPTERTARRSGLGKGLTELIAEEHGSTGLAHLNGVAEPISVPPSMRTLARVGVVETDTSVLVEVEDARGVRSEAVVEGDGSIDLAVMRAVRRLIDPDAHSDDGIHLAVVDVDPSDDDELVVVTVTQPGGRRSAGAAYVEFGRPWAVARACAQALRGS